MEPSNRETILEEKIRTGSGQIEDYFDLSALYFESGKIQNLLELYQNVITLNLSGKDLAQIYCEKGEALQSLSRSGEAIDCFLKSLSKLPSKGQTTEELGMAGINHYNLALLLADSPEGEKHSKAAVKCFNLLIEHDADNRERYAAFSHLADLYSRLGNYETSLHYYELALEVAADNSERVWALSGKAAVSAQAGRFNESAELFERALTEASDEIPKSKIYYEQGKMLFEENNFAKAFMAFQKAFGMRKYDPTLRNNREYEIDILWHLGTSSYEVEDEERAFDCLQKVLENINETHYYFANSHLTLGHLYLMSNKPGKAREHYNKVLKAPRVSQEEMQMAKDCLAHIPLAG